jgi:hypothetical protein
MSEERFHTDHGCCVSCDIVDDGCAKCRELDRCPGGLSYINKSLTAQLGEARAIIADLDSRLQTQVGLVNTFAVELGEAREALEELADLMDDVRTDDYKPDSFTTQPARIALSLTTSSALARYEAMEEVAKVAKGLQVMPDCAFEEARDVWGNTNANLYKQRFEAVREALVKLQEVVE